MLLNQRAGCLGYARVAEEGREHVQRGFGIGGGAVRVVEHDAQARHDIAERAALLELLQLTRPDQRIHPLDPLAKSGGAIAGIDATRASSAVRILRSYSALYAIGTWPSRRVQLRHDRRERRRILHFIVSDAVNLERLLRDGTTRVD